MGTGTGTRSERGVYTEGNGQENRWGQGKEHTMNMERDSRTEQEQEKGDTCRQELTEE